MIECTDTLSDSTEVPKGYYVHYPYTDITFTVPAFTSPTLEELEKLKDRDIIFVYIH